MCAEDGWSCCVDDFTCVCVYVCVQMAGGGGPLHVWRRMWQTADACGERVVRDSDRSTAAARRTHTHTHTTISTAHALCQHTEWPPHTAPTPRCRRAAHPTCPRPPHPQRQPAGWQLTLLPHAPPPHRQQSAQSAAAATLPAALLLPLRAPPQPPPRQQLLPRAQRSSVGVLWWW